MNYFIVYSKRFLFYMISETAIKTKETSIAKPTDIEFDPLVNTTTEGDAAPDGATADADATAAEGFAEQSAAEGGAYPNPHVTPVKLAIYPSHSIHPGTYCLSYKSATYGSTFLIQAEHFAP
jgi:hypothetical protein